MSDESVTEIPHQLRPAEDECRFELASGLEGVITVRTTIPDDALTASMLGTERSGHGIVINEQGLVLTIGYVITEADSVWLLDNSGAAIQGHVVAYDQESGFGLVQGLGRLNVPVLEFGQSELLEPGQPMLVAGAGGISQCLKVGISDIREFAGYWEYLLDQAVITSPAHPSWGGAALLGMDGRLYGVGSLIIHSDGEGGLESAFNMFIPIDLLKPILDDLLMYGKQNKPARPWMGWFIQEDNGVLVVVSVVEDGPAEGAGLTSGDIILAVSDRAVLDLPGLYRAVWAAGSAGVDIEVLYERGAEQLGTIVTSTDRSRRLTSAQLH